MWFTGKVTLFALVFVFSLVTVNGQSYYYKWEGFGGYAYMNLDRGIDFDSRFPNSNQNRVHSHGFNGSFTYNLHRHWGAKFDVTLNTHGEDFQAVLTTNPPPATLPPPSTFKISQTDYQFMGGVQFKDNKREGARFKPFAHVLAGIADQHLSFDETAPINTQLSKVTKTGFAMKFGGGIDIKIANHIDARVFQIDYNPIWRGSTNFGFPLGQQDSVVRNNWLLTFGVAFH